jgi:hypothetical protein
MPGEVEGGGVVDRQAQASAPKRSECFNHPLGNRRPFARSIGRPPG